MAECKPFNELGTEAENWTFAHWRAWANCRQPGAGKQFIDWVKTSYNVPPPWVFSLHSNTYGPAGPNPVASSNKAIDFMAAWILITKVGPGIGNEIATGVKEGAKLTAEAPASFAATFQTGILGFLSQLGSANLWIRAAEIIIGAGLIIVGVAKLASGTAVGKAAMKAGKAAAIL